MSRSRDRLVPIVAGGLVVVVAISVVLLLRVANNQGIDALTHAKLQQVQATADSFNARVASSLTSVAGLGNSHWQLTPNSKADERVLQTYNVDPNAQVGFLPHQRHDVVTTGILLRPGKLGSTFAPPGWAQAKQQLETKPAVILPVSKSGLTTELPSYDLVVAIRGREPHERARRARVRRGDHDDVDVQARDRRNWSTDPHQARPMVLPRQQRQHRRDDAGHRPRRARSTTRGT